MRVEIRTALIFTVVCLISNLSFGKDEVLLKPDSTVDIKIENYEVVWSQVVTEPDGKTRKGINTISDKVIVNVSENGKKIIHRIVKWTDPKNNWYIKTDKLEYDTLKPLSIDIRWNPNYVQHTDIIGQNLTSTSIKDEFSPAKLTLFQLQDVGYTWSSDGFMLNAVGKLEGNKFALQTLNNLPHSPVIGKKTFEFLRNEQVAIDNFGNFETRVFKTVDNGNTDTTYWLAKIKPYIVKVRFEQPNGQITVWKLDSVK